MSICYDKAKITLKQIVEKWPEILNNLKEFNHSLTLTLKIAHPQKVEGNKLFLGFSYKFHQERINQAKNKEIIERALKEIYGLPLKIESTFDETLSKNEKKNLESDDIEELAKSFGGKVVE